MDPPPPHPPVLARILLAAVAILMWALVSLAVAAISNIVHYIYANHDEDPTVIKSIFKSLLGALFRLFITLLWVFPITVIVVVAVSIPLRLWALVFKPKDLVDFFILGWLQHIFVAIALLVLGFLFLLAHEVAVLEPENYGLEALKRSSKLVKAKLSAALTLFIVSSIIWALLSKISSVAAIFPTFGKLPHWTVYHFAVLLALLYLAFWTYIITVTAVLYFSSKAKYATEEESLPQSRHRETDFERSATWTGT